MYLMDDISTAADAIGDKKNPILDIYGDMQRRLRGTPRFLLDDAAIATAVELTLGRPKVFFEALANVRVPYPAMWVEWLESGREKLRRTFGGNEYLITADRPLPTRLGFLIEADKETGRQGAVTWVWAGPDADNVIEDVNFPNIGVISPYFNLDAKIPQSEDRIRGFLGGNLAKMWKDHPVQLEALFDLWRTADHRPNPWGLNYLESIYEGRGERALEKFLSNGFADVYGEYIIVWGIILLLTSTRRIVEYRAVDNAKLNKARLKRRQVPLLDHTRVIVRVHAAPTAGQPRQPLGYARKSPRVHLVSSYLNRRGDKHWVVSPFWRGSGETIHREVRVKG